MYRLEDAAAPFFARHETFHPRYGWFRKGVSAAGTRPDVFRADDAPVELGVGKNMVRAIRFWSKAAKLLSDAENPDRPRLPLTAPSHNGIALFDEGIGLDPYLELPGSLWLLHWWMLAPTCLLPVWWLAFNQFGSVEFSQEDLLRYIVDALERSASWDLPILASLKKDVDCLVRMYAPHASGRSGLDDLLDCPFRELGLIEPVWDDRRRYRFVLGSKPTLPAAIVGYACIDYLATADPGSSTITISRLTHSPGSPGRVFKLTEQAVAAALEEFCGSRENARLASAAGVVQLAVRGDVGEVLADTLHRHYQDCGRSVPCPARLGAEAVIATPALIQASPRVASNFQSPLLTRRAEN